VTGGTTPYTYLWSNDSTTQDINSLVAGWYYITVTDSLGCTVLDSLEITSGIVVNASAKWDSIICPGDSVQIFGFGGDPFVWSPTLHMSDPTVFDPLVSPPVPTWYYFTAYDSICFDVDSVFIDVYPGMNLDAGADVTILYDHPITVTVTCDDPTATFQWVPSAGVSDSTASTVELNPEMTTVYYVLATNANGCVVIDTLVITVIPRIVFPTGITPNGDGMNDDWEIDYIEWFEHVTVEVYNRWGEQLYYYDGTGPGYDQTGVRWDGYYNGNPLPVGTYYFIVNLHDELIEPMTGPITILR
jgi:gliding motility-associated-like protein